MTRYSDPRVKPLPWAQIDRRHPLAQDLHRAWLFNDGVASNRQDFWDVVYNDMANYTRSNADTYWQAGLYGPKFKIGADGGSATLTAGPSGLGGDSVTIVGRMTPTGANPFLEAPATGTSHLYCCRTNTNDISPTLAITSSAVRFAYDTSGNLVGANNTYTFNAGTEYTIGGTYLRDTNVATYRGTWDTWVNGVRQGSSNNWSVAGSASSDFTNTTARVFHPHLLSGPYTSDKIADWLFLWKRALSADEMRWLNEEPFCMFLPSVVPRFFGFGGSGSTLAMRGASSSLAFDTARLGGVAALRTADRTAAFSGGRVTGTAALRARSDSAAADTGRASLVAAMRAASFTLAFDAGRVTGLAALRARSEGVAADKGAVRGLAGMRGLAQSVEFAAAGMIGAKQMRGLSVAVAMDRGELVSVTIIGGQLLGDITLLASLSGELTLGASLDGAASLMSTLYGTARIDG